MGKVCKNGLNFILSSGADAINKFKSIVAMLRWNKAIWLIGYYKFYDCIISV